MKKILILAFSTLFVVGCGLKKPLKLQHDAPSIDTTEQIDNADQVVRLD